MKEQMRAEFEARKDAAYLERNQVVAALAKCFPSGIAKTAIEGWSEDWNSCVYIDLPTGQTSWHYHDSQAYLFADLPAYKGKWDGHTTEEKYARIARLQPTQEPAGQVKHLSNDVIIEWFDGAPADDTFVYLSTQQPAQEPVGSDYTVLITRLAYALKKANPESDLPIKATVFLKCKGYTFDPLRDMQEPVKQEPYAYDVPTEDGTELAYAIYFTKYGRPIPEGAIPLYLEAQP